LSTGSTVHARVVAHVGKNTWRLAIGNRTVTARVAVPVRLGEHFLARVERNGSEIILRQIQRTSGQSTLTRVLSAAGVPQNAVSQTILAHFVHAQHSLDPARIARLYRMAERVGVRSPREARLLSVLAGKGIEPSDESSFRRLIGSLDSLSAHDQRDQGEPNAGGGGGRRHPDPRRRERDSNQPERLKQELKSAITRTDDSTTSPLPVFNHLASDEGHWVVIPISLSVGEESRRANLRLYRKDLADPFSHGVLDVELSGRRMSFSMDREKGGYRVIVRAASQDDRVARSLADLLANTSVISEVLFTDRPEGFDGFSTEDLSAIVYGVDTDV
jgi:hypothetical protein